MELRLEGEKEVNAAIRAIIKDTNNRKTLIKEVMRPAAKIVTKVMREMAPKLDSAPVFNVYRTPKLSGKLKAPKGMGKIYVSSKPGQLRKSIFHFQTKATRRAGGIAIGPRFKKGVWIKPEKGGWYMNIVQTGTDTVQAQPFVVPALMSTRKGVGNLMVRNLKRRLKTTVSSVGKGLEFK